MSHLQPEALVIRRVLFFNRSCYLDDSHGAAIASRATMRVLARHGFDVEVLSGSLMETDRQGDPAELLAERGLNFQAHGTPDKPDGPPCLRADIDKVAVVIHRRPLRRYQPPDSAETDDLLRLLEAAFDRRTPDVLLTYGPDPLTAEVLARARWRGIATAFVIHHFHYRHPATFANVDAILTPSRFAADYYRESLGLACTVLPNPIDLERVRGEEYEPQYVTFITPTAEKGVYPFARIADELGRRRPDIPLLVVEGRGTEAALTACGLDLGRHGNLHIMPCTPDPRDFWEVSRLCLIPSLWWENQPLTAIEAMTNGIPVIASNRGGLPETLGAAGIVLPLPSYLTTATRFVPTAEEVAPWVEAVIRLWDDTAVYDHHRRLALAEAARWAPRILEPRYVRYFANLSTQRDPPANFPTPATDPRVQAIAEAFPWPDQKPEVVQPDAPPDGPEQKADSIPRSILAPQMRLIVELGSWPGMSARFLADRLPNAIVIGVGHRQDKAEQAPSPYEAFLARCWSHRDRIIPLRMTALTGLQTVADFGLEPDLICVNVDHTDESIGSVLELARWLFPRATLTGDDHQREAVARAVVSVADRHGLAAGRSGPQVWTLTPSRPIGITGSRLPPGRATAAVLVPYLDHIEPECEQALFQLERAGVRVVRRAGTSAIDVARNEMASHALHDGFQSLLFVDADLGFDPLDALRLLARPEPVVAGLYAKKGCRELTSIFALGVTEVLFGPDAPGLYPLKYAATGFLRLHAALLRRMIQELDLPLCNTKWGRGSWPFFQPIVLPLAEGGHHYLGEDWAFSHRLGQIGVVPLADTAVRLWHYGRHPYGWEDAGTDSPPRHKSFTYHLR